MNARDIILAPVITEKAVSMLPEKKYTFRVAPEAGKIEIAKAVEELFKVKVADVNIMNYLGKTRRSGRTGTMGRRANWKRAVITLAEGSIEII